MGIEESFNWKSKSEKSVSETDKAEEWLLAFMDGKRVLTSEVEAAAKAEGFARNSLYRVKKKLGIVSDRQNGVSS